MTFIYIETRLPLVCQLNKFIISMLLALKQSLVSSANVDILLTILVSISCIPIRNRSGPITWPCGTPDVTGAQFLWD